MDVIRLDGLQTGLLIAYGGQKMADWLSGKFDNLYRLPGGAILFVVYDGPKDDENILYGVVLCQNDSQIARVFLELQRCAAIEDGKQPDINLDNIFNQMGE